MWSLIIRDIMIQALVLALTELQLHEISPYQAMEARVHNSRQRSVGTNVSSNKARKIQADTRLNALCSHGMEGRQDTVCVLD